MSSENKPNQDRQLEKKDKKFEIDEEGRITTSDENLEKLSDELTSEELTPENLDEVAGSGGLGCNCYCDVSG